MTPKSGYYKPGKISRFNDMTDRSGVNDTREEVFTFD